MRCLLEAPRIIECTPCKSTLSATRIHLAYRRLFQLFLPCALDPPSGSNIHFPATIGCLFTIQHTLITRRRNIKNIKTKFSHDQLRLNLLRPPHMPPISSGSAAARTHQRVYFHLRKVSPRTLPPHHHETRSGFGTLRRARRSRRARAKQMISRQPPSLPILCQGTGVIQVQVRSTLNFVSHQR